MLELSFFLLTTLARDEMDLVLILRQSQNGGKIGVFKPDRCSYRCYGVQRRRSLHFDLGIPIDYHNKNDFHGIDEMNLDRSVRLGAGWLRV